MDELRPEGRRRAVSGGPLDGKPFEVTGYEVWVAWQKVRGNKGAPGVDAVSIAAFEERLEDNLYKVWNRMAAGSYFPPPVRAVEIPKAGGGTRGLGVPTVADRVVQASLKAVLEPIFEADFKPCSYGFRPNRRAQDAIAEIHHYGTSGYRWVLECDIKACFDEIDHTALMDRLRARIKDKRVCALVKAFLKSGVLTGPGDREETLTGTPQGGILSPLLANIALSALDDHFDRQWHQEMGSDGQRRKRRRDGKGNWKIIRYADDFVLMVHGERRHAQALREEVAVLAPMGLRLAPEKTAVVHLDEGFTFLGFDIRRMRKRGTQKYYACTRPSRKAIQSIKDKVAARTYRSTRHMGLDELIASLNRSLAGWANYFRHGVSKAVFSAVDSHAWHRLMRWIRAKYKQGNHRIGMPELRRRFCDQGWRFACNGVVFTGASSVAVTRYRYRGSTIPTPWTPAPAPR